MHATPAVLSPFKVGCGVGYHSKNTTTNMVKLSFKVAIPAPIDQVWGFFGDFGNVTQWDPNTARIQPLQQNTEMVGSTYRLTTLLNEKDERSVTLKGQNDDVTAEDQMICRASGPDLTEFEYKADICLRGWKWIFTPLIMSVLKNLVVHAREGCLSKATQLFGQAEVVA